MKSTLLFALSILFLSSVQAKAQSFLEMAGLTPSARYQHFETEHFEFDFQEGYLHFTKEAAKHFEHVHTVLSPILQWKPRTKIHVLIADNEDSANGFAMPSLRVGMVLIATPPDQWYSTSYSDNWIKLLAFHEYVHILNIDPTTKWMETLRLIFGDVIRPNGLWPRWMLEGLAVYFETRTSILGRGRSPYYDAIVRSFFNEGLIGSSDRDIFNYGTLSGNWPYFPSGEVPYLFGYHLWNQFEKDQKDDSKTGTYSINSSHRFPFFIDGNLDQVTGKQWNDYWRAFVADGNNRYSEQIKQVKSEGETLFKKISDSKYSSIGGAISPDGRWLAYTETRLDERPGLILVDLRNHSHSIKIRDKVQGASLSFTPDSKKLIFSSLERNTTFTLFSDLFAYDLESHQFHQLTMGARAKDPDVSPNGKQVTFVVSDHGTNILKIGDLVLDGSKPGIENIRTVHEPEEFSILATPRWLNDVEIIFALQNLNSSESKIMKTSTATSKSPIDLVANGKMNRFPIRCGNRILHVSDETGIDNIYEGNQRITNAITAVQFPFCSSDGQLFGSLLTANGFEVVQFIVKPSAYSRLSNKKMATPDAPESINEALQSPDLKQSTFEISEYSPIKSMAPRQWAPIAEINFNNVSDLSVGGMILGFDASGKHQYLADALYNFKSSTIDGNLSYTYYGFRPSITFLGGSTTTIGNTTYLRKHEAGLQFDFINRWTWQDLQVTPYILASSTSRYQISSHQKIAETTPAVIPLGGLSLTYRNLYTSKLGFMPEKGFQFSTLTETRSFSDSTLVKFAAEYSHYLPLGEHKVLNPRLRQYQSSDYIGLIAGRDPESIVDRGSGINLTRMKLRGYTNLNFDLKSASQLGLDFHFPLKTAFAGSGPFFLQQTHGFIFAENTYILDSAESLISKKSLPSVGLGITSDTTLVWLAPISFNLEVQYGTNKQVGGDLSYFISMSSSAL